jgi:hypothetical protein
MTDEPDKAEKPKAAPDSTPVLRQNSIQLYFQ